jgi:hypothetical protein
VCLKVLDAFPQLSPYLDARITIGVESGEDLKLSPLAKSLFPYSVECKYREVFKTLYGFYDQAAKGDGEPLLVVKMNNKPAMAIITLDKFFELIKGKNNA